MRRDTHRVGGGELLRWAGSLLSIALLIYLISRQGWDEILDSAAEIPVSSLAKIIGLMIISRIAVSLRWYSLVRAVDQGFPFRESLRLTLAGLFAANFLPTTVGGDVVRVAGVLRRSKNRMDAATSIAADRIVGLTGMAMLVPLGLYESWGWIITQVQRGNDTRFLYVLMPPFLLGIAGSEPLQRMFAKVRRGLRSLLSWLKRPGALLTALGFTWVHQLCLFSNIWLLLNGMQDGLDWWLIAGLWSLSYFITLMPFSIGGLGIREISITFIFQEIGGISVETALALAVLLRAIDILASLPGSLFLPTILSSMRKESA